MREMDFSEKNLWLRWFGVKEIWRQLEGEVQKGIKRGLETYLRVAVDARVGCRRYERSRSRRDYRNGYYTRDLLTKYGWLEGLRVPRLREGSYQTEAFKKYRRRQRQLDAVLLEGFLLGHSTRKTRRAFKAAFGAEVSAQTVSNVVKELDQEVCAFHRRRLSDHYRFLYLDGFSLSLRKPLKMKKVILVAMGVNEDGTSELVSFQLAPSESEACWWGFLYDLKHRGLWGENLEVIVSDGCPGLIKGIQAHYSRVKHQRCTFHKATDLAKYLVQKSHRQAIIADALHVFEGKTEREVRERLRFFCDKWQAKEPRAVKNLLKDFEYCLTYLEYPEPIRSRLKTNNPLERYLEEIRRRIIPMRSFNNARSAERIIYGIIAYALNNPEDMPKNEFTQNA